MVILCVQYNSPICYVKVVPCTLGEPAAVPSLYEDYTRRVEPRSKLDQAIDQIYHGVEKHLPEIAMELEHLDELVPALGCRQRVLREIQTAHPHDLLQQK